MEAAVRAKRAAIVGRNIPEHLHWVRERSRIEREYPEGLLCGEDWAAEDIERIRTEAKLG